MVPEHHRCPVSGVVLLGKAQEVRQRLAVAHAGGGLLVHQRQPVAAVHIALQHRGVHRLVPPLCRAAGLNDHGHILRQLHLQQLTEIVGGKAALRLQITAAEVPVYRPAAVCRAIGRVQRLIAAGRQAQGHHQRQKQRKKTSFLHIRSPAAAFSWRRIPPRSARRCPAASCTSAAPPPCPRRERRPVPVRRPAPVRQRHRCPRSPERRGS